MKKTQLAQYIAENITTNDTSYRGGTIKVDLTNLLSQKSLKAIENAGEEPIAGTSQNYLGGGMAGRITSGRSFDLNLLTEKDMHLYQEFAKN